MDNPIVGLTLETLYFAWVLLKYTWPVFALILLGGVFHG